MQTATGRQLQMALRGVFHATAFLKLAVEADQHWLFIEVGLH